MGLCDFLGVVMRLQLEVSLAQLPLGLAMGNAYFLPFNQIRVCHGKRAGLIVVHLNCESRSRDTLSLVNRSCLTLDFFDKPKMFLGS